MSDICTQGSPWLRPLHATTCRVIDMQKKYMMGVKSYHLTPVAFHSPSALITISTAGRNLDFSDKQLSSSGLSPPLQIPTQKVFEQYKVPC